MNLPNLSLMRQYGNSDVFFKKTAGLMSSFAEKVTGSVFSGHMIHDAHLQMDHQKMEAHQMNEQIRLVEDRIMGPSEQNLRHTQAPLFVQAGSDVPVGWDEGMVRLASIARDVGTDLTKLAIGASMLPAPGKLTMTPSTLTSKVAPAAAPVGFSAPQKPGVLGQIQQSISGKPGELAGHKGTELPAKNTAPINQPAPAQAGAAKPGFMESTFGNHWKAKGLALAGMAGAGYAGLKGLNKGLGWASREPQTPSWGGSGGYQLPMGVNQYGVPQNGTPLM